MKKSELLEKAQISVLKDWDITPQHKLEIVNVLTGIIDLEKYREKKAEEEKAGKENGEL